MLSYRFHSQFRERFVNGSFNENKLHSSSRVSVAGVAGLTTVPPLRRHTLSCGVVQKSPQIAG